MALICDFLTPKSIAEQDAIMSTKFGSSGSNHVHAFYLFIMKFVHEVHKNNEIK